MTSFSAATYQNEFLPAGGTEMHAIVTVTAAGDVRGGEATTTAEIIIVDVSGSMNVPRTKIRAAREATTAAIDCIRNGVQFGVIAGSEDAEVVFPRSGGLVAASDSTRDEARAAVKKLKAGGGTVISEWLVAANRLFQDARASISHAILLTDGENDGESPAQLERGLRECEGNFQCDCRGVGTDWRVSELRQVASTLLGTVDIIAAPEEMAADFTSIMQTAMGKSVGDVRLRVWVPQGASLTFVKQVAPAIEDLSDKAVSVNDLTKEYPTGAWGSESRDYHVCIQVPAREVDDEMLAGRVSLVVDGEVTSQSLIRAVWTADQELSTKINREVAHYTGQAELAQTIQEGLAARKAGDEHSATMKLGRAVQLASETGNDATMKLLSSVVDVEDAVTGTVRLRRGIDAADEMALDTRSTKTTRIEIGE